MTNKYQTYNPKRNNQLQEPMFFGQNVNVARYDQQKFPIFDKLTDRQHSLFWRAEEIDLTKDYTDFKALTEHEQHIFTENLKYQILLDSVQGRGPSTVLLPITSLPEVESWLLAWSFFESIHSRAYTHIIRNLFNNPSEIFDTIVTSPEIAKRAKAVTDLYDNLQYAVDAWRAGTGDLVDAKKALILCVASINILEGVRFYVSFACSFSFAERKVMEGNAKEIRLVQRDEALHLAATQHIMKIWRDGKDGEEMQLLYKELEPQIRQIMLDAGEQEKEWTTHLFKQGSMLGLNKKILDQYVEHIIDIRLKGLRLEPEFGSPKNPIPWIDSWLSSDSVQVAPQETEKTDYLTGAIDSKINQEAFGSFTL